MRKLLLLSVLVSALVSCESSEERTQRFFNLGNRALNDGNNLQAIEFYNQALKESPNYAPALNNRGVARIESDHPYEAILDYNKAIGLDPDYIDALFNRAIAYEEIGQFSNALRDVQFIQTLKKDSAYVYFYEGLLQTKLRNYDLALSRFNVADSLVPSNPETIINKATIFYFQEKYDSAKALVNTVLGVAPVTVLLVIELVKSPIFIEVGS